MIVTNIFKWQPALKSSMQAKYPIEVLPKVLDVYKAALQNKDEFFRTDNKKNINLRGSR